MKPARIVQVLLVLVLAVYLVLLHNANPVGVTLPLMGRFLPPLPPAWILAFAIVVSWLIGWLPGRLALWRKGREVRQLGRKIQELEQHVPSYDQDLAAANPVIPDRSPSASFPPPTGRDKD